VTCDLLFGRWPGREINRIVREVTAEIGAALFRGDMLILLGKQMNKVIASAVAAIIIVIVVIISDAYRELKRRPSRGILFILSKWLN
jgi:hypothetical protein